ncbi:MAG: MBL fold metallo-hydrolase [Crocinitomicaceae bacterium]|nr:MBL fold metallo-hydrolase [Flavobacteriales bacterium]NQZ35254.1 MBL fold metallo-hydrolase [Crocinitomicaceae bacterium]
MKITMLGTGTSQGVPVIACDCKVCTSTDERDNRLRCSVLISIGEENYCIDSGPDFRQQMLREQVNTLSGIIFTHEHKDHVAGLDDVRAFNFREKKDMDIYCSTSVEAALRREFHYAFAEDKYPGVPSLNIIPIDTSPFKLTNGVEIIPIEVLHYEMPVLGFRIGDFTYITDAKTVSEEEKSKIYGSEILVVNALRKEEHISHFNLEEALAFIAEVNPKKAYLTHISHLFGTHEEILSMLPPNVYPAYDGLTFDLKS